MGREPGPGPGLERGVVPVGAVDHVPELLRRQARPTRRVHALCPHALRPHRQVTPHGPHRLRSRRRMCRGDPAGGAGPLEGAVLALFDFPRGLVFQAVSAEAEDREVVQRGLTGIPGLTCSSYGPSSPRRAMLMLKFSLRGRLVGTWQGRFHYRAIHWHLISSHES